MLGSQVNEQAKAAASKTSLPRLPHRGVGDRKRGTSLRINGSIYMIRPVQVGRIQNFRAWSPEMVPASSSASCYGLEYFCFEEEDGLWAKTDRDLERLAAEELVTLGLAEQGQIIGAKVVRQPKAYPVYDETYSEHVALIRSVLEQDFPTLHLVGRNGMHKYNNQDHSMMTSILCVEKHCKGRNRSTIFGK